ncbi:hypothetical protein ACF1A5_19280 [Streptomyces sp. NPDC014864]|uniref:hypothetical protein n=1 Tax=Streptomyces sp. NPDC014864 TaxID=3364924 RepID=UPI003700FE01
MEGWKFWWGIAAFFLGGLSTQLNGWLTYRRQRKDKARDAEEAVRKRREEFELEHLVEFNQMLRTAMDRVLNLRNVASRELDTPAHYQERDEAAEALDAALWPLSAQVGFIIDHEVRDPAISLISRMRSESVSGRYGADVTWRIWQRGPARFTTS